MRAVICIAVSMFVAIASLDHARAADPPLLDATFKSDVSPMALVAGDARYEDGCAAISAGTRFIVRSAAPLGGDLSIVLSFREPYSGEAVIRHLGVPALTARYSAQHAAVIREPLAGEAAEPPSAGREHAQSSPREIVLRVRNVGAELDVDGVSCAATAFVAPSGGGTLEIELAPTAHAFLDSIRVERLPYADRDRVTGIDDAKLAELAGQPLQRFKLLEPLPRHLDPIYRVAVEGLAEPIVVHGRGYRSDESPIPLLEQALAFAQIRPWFDVQFLKGDGGSGAGVIPLSEDGKTVTIDTPPGTIRLSTLCGILGDWPVLVVLDATRNRVLIRTNPGGPASADVWSTIPKQCQKLRIVLSVPNRPSIEREIEIVRP